MKEKLTITIDSELLKTLKKLAERENRSMSNLVEVLIRHAVRPEGEVNHD